MTETPIADAAQAAVARPGERSPAVIEGTTLAVPTQQELAAILGTRVIDMRGWISALAEQSKFEETEQEDAGLSIVRAILAAETSEQVFAAMAMRTSEELCPKDPGSRSQVMEFRGAFPLASTFEEGPSVFSVASVADVTSGEQFTFSVGARAVQAAFIAHMINGWYPFTFIMARRKKPTRAGFYPLNLERGI
jgi:hypothetical protein